MYAGYAGRACVVTLPQVAGSVRAGNAATVVLPGCRTRPSCVRAHVCRQLGQAVRCHGAVAAGREGDNGTVTRGVNGTGTRSGTAQSVIIGVHCQVRAIRNVNATRRMASAVSIEENVPRYHGRRRR